MFLKKTSRFLVVCLVSASSTAFAADVSLTCPTGTVQKGAKVSKRDAVYCAKTGQKQGEPTFHGPYVDFWANGQKQSQGQYENGARSGRWTFWDANGVKTGETEFAAGDYHGMRVEYFPNGHQRLVEQYQHGKKNGVVKEMSQDGKVIRQAQYQDDREVAAR